MGSGGFDWSVDHNKNCSANSRSDGCSTGYWLRLMRTGVTNIHQNLQKLTLLQRLLLVETLPCRVVTLNETYASKRSTRRGTHIQRSTCSAYSTMENVRPRAFPFRRTSAAPAGHIGHDTAKPLAETHRTLGFPPHAFAFEATIHKTAPNNPVPLRR